MGKVVIFLNKIFDMNLYATILNLLNYDIPMQTVNFKFKFIIILKLNLDFNNVAF